MILVVQGSHKSGKSTFIRWLADREARTILRHTGLEFPITASGDEERQRYLFVWERPLLTQENMQQLEEVAIRGEDLVVETIDAPTGFWPNVLVINLRPSPNYEEQALNRFHAELFQ